MDIRRPILRQNLIISFIMLIILAASASVASADNDAEDVELQTSRANLARELGFKKHASLDSVYSIYKTKGSTEAKKYLYFAEGAIKGYRLKQKMGDGYCSYVGKSNYELPKIIIVKMLPGEQIIKNSFFPGFLYQFLGTMKLTLIDGFSGNAIVIRRVLTDDQKKGFGNPPSDAECRTFLIGTWLFDKIEFGQEVTDKFTFSPDGTMTVIQKDVLASSKKKYETSHGTWKISKGTISYSYSNANGAENAGRKIIKLTKNQLVMHDGWRERWFYKEKKYVNQDPQQ